MFFTLSGLAWLGWIASLGYYGYCWAKAGTWAPTSTLEALCWVSGCGMESWLSSPADWLGIHSMLSSATLPVSLFTISAALAIAGAMSSDA